MSLFGKIVLVLGFLAMLATGRNAEALSMYDFTGYLDDGIVSRSEHSITWLGGNDGSRNSGALYVTTKITAATSQARFNFAVFPEVRDFGSFCDLWYPAVSFFLYSPGVDAPSHLQQAGVFGSDAGIFYLSGGSIETFFGSAADLPDQGKISGSAFLDLSGFLGQTVTMGWSSNRDTPSGGELMLTDVEFAPVPEPSTFLLLGFGLASLAYLGRRQAGRNG